MSELYPASETVFYRAGKIAQRNSKHTQTVDYLQCALAVNYGGEFIADRRAHRFPELLRHETRRRTRRDPARFQHQYLVPVHHAACRSASGTCAVLPVHQAALRSLGAAAQRGSPGSRAACLRLGSTGPSACGVGFRINQRSRTLARGLGRRLTLEFFQDIWPGTDSRGT